MKKNTIYLGISVWMVLAGLQIANAQTPIANDQEPVQTKTETISLPSSELLAKPAAEQKIEAFKAGGTLINIPLPGTNLVEVGYDVREQMEVFVPPSNRLLCGYMQPSDIPLFMKGEENFVLSQYASIQIARQGEYQDCTIDNFNELVDYVKNSLGDELDSIIEESEDTLNSRMKSMDLTNISIDKPVQLGTLFSKTDAYSMGMISTYSDGKKSWTLVIATTFVRVRERLLFVYVFNTYENEETITMVRRLAEHWADAILAANK
ncbi:MAG: hypothetical protein V1747_09905 [Candidatus Omnitrophota bacterium]